MPVSFLAVFSISFVHSEKLKIIFIGTASKMNKMPNTLYPNYIPLALLS